MVARRAHNPEVIGSNPVSATIVVSKRHVCLLTNFLWRRSLVGYSGRFIPGRSLVRIRPPLPLLSLCLINLIISGEFYAVEFFRKQYLPRQGIAPRPLGQAVKTPPFHGGIMGSNPVGVTKVKRTCYYLTSSFFAAFYFAIRFYKPYFSIIL